MRIWSGLFAQGGKGEFDRVFPALDNEVGVLGRNGIDKAFEEVGLILDGLAVDAADEVTGDESAFQLTFREYFLDEDPMYTLLLFVGCRVANDESDCTKHDLRGRLLRCGFYFLIEEASVEFFSISDGGGDGVGFLISPDFEGDLGSHRALLDERNELARTADCMSVESDDDVVCL